MSVRIMSAVWQVDLPGTEKLVLLALADWSNDDGRCWPSMQQLATKSGLTDRAVRAIIGRLVDKGLLGRDEKPGKGVNYTVYPGTSFRPEEASPRKETAKTPERRSANTSRTTIPKKDKPSLDMRASKFALPDRIPAQPWADFEDMRRRIGKPMTQRAKELAVMRLDKLAEDGWPPGDVLNHSTLNSYQGLFPPKDDRHGRQQQPQSLRGTRPDPALDMLRQAQAELAAASYQDPDRPAWPSLPSFGSG